MCRLVLNDDLVCPKCKDLLRKDVNIGDGFLYDVCLSCGFKRKYKVGERAEETKQESK